MKTQKGVEIPQVLAQALSTQYGLLNTLERMRPSCQREYVEWITSAKTDEAQTKRIALVLERIFKWGEHHPQK
jgi:uncharacterized protein YdeI (YjbR/CyaY-like superfamily)